MRIVKRLVALSFVALALLAPRLTSGQSIYGSIVGTVNDSSGAVVPGVTVTVTNEGTGESRTLVTGGAGDYRALNLPSGRYTVTAELSGFKKILRSGVIVQVNTTPRIDLMLDVGSPAETVEVLAETPLLNSDSSGLGQVVDAQQLDALPLVSGGGGRNFFMLAMLSAGTTAQVGQGYALNNLRINGGRPRNDDYLLDGTSIQAIVFGGPTIVPPPDAIQEFRVETNAFPAEYGRISGGIMSAITKSGSNLFHGTGWVLFRDDKLDARNVFLPADEEKPDLRHWDYGVTFGGPIIKDKLFFFADYQRVTDTGQRPQIGTQVPTAAMKGGNFSQFLTSNAIGTDPCGATVFEGSIIDPVGGCAFAGNVIPSARFSPISNNFLPLWPDPNAGGFNYDRLAAAEQRIHQFDVRMDYLASNTNKFFGALHWRKSESISPNRLPDSRAVSQLGQKNNPITATVGWDHTFGPNVFNTLRFGFMTRDPARTSGGYQEVGPSDYGFTGVFDCPDTMPDSGGKCGTPQMSVSGFQGLGGGRWLFEPAKIFQVAESLSWIKDDHAFKFGADYRHFAIDNSQPNSINGNFSFNQDSTAFPGAAGDTGHAFASFLLGYSNNGSWQYQDDFFKTGTNSISLYAQDDWRITPSLTLNLGLRYQVDMAWKARVSGTAGGFDRDALAFFMNGVNGVPEDQFNTKYNQLGPRLGFAWNPRPGMVIRGAYGLLFPGNTTHGRGGDLSPAVLFDNNFGAVQIDNLPPILAPTLDELQEVFLDPNRGGFGQNSPWPDRDQDLAKFHQWNLTFEKEFFGDTVLAASYAGSAGRNLIANYWWNPYQLTEAQVLAGDFGDGPLGPPGNASVGWLDNDLEYGSRSDYNSIQLRAQKRFSKGYSFLATYTYSRLKDDASSDWSGFGGLDTKGQNNFDREGEYTVSAGDVTNRFTLSGIVELPSPEGGVARAILGDWQLSGIFQYFSGLPFGADDSCYGFCNSARTWANKPDLVGDPNAGRTDEQWVNADAYESTWFVADRPFGNVPRFDENVREPTFINLDLQLRKSFPFGDGKRFEFRVDAFNVLNRGQLGRPGNNIGSGVLGRIRNTRFPNRQIQLGARFVF